MNEKSSCPVLRGRDGGNTILLLDGKTQIAVEYAYQHRQDYQIILWTRADTVDALIAGYDEIAHLLYLPVQDQQDQHRVIRAVQEWFRTQTKWLLIFDNADELAVVREFLPPTFGGHILLTTRAQSVGRLAARIEVDALDLEAGALLLLRRAALIAADASLDAATPSNLALARTITDELGGLPLALDQAGAYVDETSCSLSEYHRLYHLQRKELLNARGDLVGDHPKPVATTWSLSFQQVEKRSVAAMDLLRLCAYFAPDAIPEKVIIKGAEHIGSDLQAVAHDSSNFHKAIAILSAYSLIHRNVTSQTISIHRLVQAVLRDQMSVEEDRAWKQRVILAVHASSPSVEDMGQWEAYERWLPHGLMCATWIDQAQMHNRESVDVLDKVASYLYHRGRYVEAEPLYQQVLPIQERTLGSDHPDVAFSLNKLAHLYREQGKHEEAELLFQRALSIREQALGPNHPTVATTLTYLATLYHWQCKNEQAEPLYQRALSILEQALGPDHPDMASPLNGLANLYSTQKKYEQAESLYLRSLHIREQALGPDHPSVAFSLSGLAGLYGMQGKYEQAEQLGQQALRIRKQALGPDHPSVAFPLNDLASLYRMQGKYEQTEQLYQQALRICEQTVGPDSFYVSFLLNGLAGLYKEQGKYEQAEFLLKRALPIYESTWGKDHTYTRAVNKNYISLLQLIGRNDEAKKLEEET